MLFKTFPLLLLVFWLLPAPHAHAQCREIDSLQKVIPSLEGKRKVDAQNDLAHQYIKSKQWELALAVVEHYALPLAQSIRYEKGIAESYLNFGSCSYFRDNKDESFSKAVEMFQKALKILQKEGTDDDRANAYETRADFYWEVVYLKQEHLDSSAKYYVKAYELYIKAKNEPKASLNASNAARAFFELGNNVQSGAYIKKAIEIEQNKSGYSETKFLNRLMEDQVNASRAFTYAMTAVGLLIVAVTVGLWFAFMQVRKSNHLLEGKNKEIEDRNAELTEKKAEIEQKNIRLQETFAELERSNTEIQKKNTRLEETHRELEAKNKEVERGSKELMLKQVEIEMRNKQLADANEELQQSQEEIKSQRDNVEQLARELAAQADELKRSYETLTILSSIGQTITSSLDINHIFDSFYMHAAQLMITDSFRLLEFEEETGELVYKYNMENNTKKPLVKIQMREGNNPAVMCAREGKPITINRRADLALYGLDEYAMRKGYHAMLYYPLFDDGKPKGAVGVYSRSEYAYDERDRESLRTLSTYAMIALKNAETYAKLNTAQAQLVESEKMAALGNLVAGVAHEINTPVGICVTAASRVDSKTQEFIKVLESGQMKRKDMTDFLEMATEGSKILLTNLKRAADLVQSFKRVAVEQSSEEKRMFNLKTYIEETVLALRPELKNKPFEVILDLEEVEIDSYAGAFSQVLTNFIMNSLIHGFKGKNEGHIRIKTATRNRQLVLTYSDDGNGMTPEVLEKIYEPFFTTNRANGGSGLGMNIVYNLVAQKLGGKIQVESSVGKGVTFTIEIPMP